MTPLPVGFRLRADRRTTCHDNSRVLVGRASGRVLRLSERGAAIARALLHGDPVDSEAAGMLARRLVDAGLAHPVPRPGSVDVEVVVPAFGAASTLDRCLAAIGAGLAVTIVDDGSTAADAEMIRTVTAKHGARLVRSADNGGPAAARNAGVRMTKADVVAFVDSDALVSAATLRRLAAHLHDPSLAAVAPRIRPLPRPHLSTLAAFARAMSPLDMGADSSLVRSGRPVAYVPSTVLLVRRSAFEAVGGFEPSLRYGEDVDLVWRLTDAGHDVRYDAAVHAHHDEPLEWSRWLRRRFHYGTSAAPLAARHGGRAVSLRVHPAPFAAAALVATRHGRLGTVATVVPALRVGARLRRAGLPAASTTAAAMAAPLPTAVGTSRWLTQLWWPALLGVAITSRRHRWAAVTAALAPAVVDWRRSNGLDLVRWTLCRWADDAAYGAGVWAGSVRHHRLDALVPHVIYAADTPTTSAGNGSR